jgi:pimeloyl-ACP methyl ester carboxylesterase
MARLLDSRLRLRATAFAMRAAARFSVRLSGFLADRLYFTPWRMPLSDKARERQREWLRGSRPIVLEIAGRRIAGFEAGAGPNVLLLHGWGEASGRMGAFVAPLVQAGYRVLAIDLPAHGESSGHRTNAYEAAEVIRAVADRVGGVEAVVAHSMGAHATVFAVTGGMSVNSVVLLSPSTRFDHVFEKFVALFALPPRAGERAQEKDRSQIRPVGVG